LWFRNLVFEGFHRKAYCAGAASKELLAVLRRLQSTRTRGMLRIRLESTSTSGALG